jgi:hypothetical protein
MGGGWTCSLYDWAAADRVDRGGRGLSGVGALPDWDAAKPGGASSAFAITINIKFNYNFKSLTLSN